LHKCKERRILMMSLSRTDKRSRIVTILPGLEDPLTCRKLHKRWRVVVIRPDQDNPPTFSPPSIICHKFYPSLLQTDKLSRIVTIHHWSSRSADNFSSLHSANRIFFQVPRNLANCQGLLPSVPYVMICWQVAKWSMVTGRHQFGDPLRIGCTGQPSTDGDTVNLFAFFVVLLCIWLVVTQSTCQNQIKVIVAFWLSQ